MAYGCEVLINATPSVVLVQPARAIVREAVGASTTYSLYYDFHIGSGDYPLLLENDLGPESELAVRVGDGSPTGTAVLVNGPVTHQRVGIVNGGNGSVLEVVGADFLIALAREAKVVVWSRTNDADAISTVLNGVPVDSNVVIASNVVHDDTKHALIQRESDLHLIRRLARRNGCWIWIEYDAVTLKPKVRVERPPVMSTPAVDLYVAGPKSNADGVDILWDVERVVSTDAGSRDVFGATDVDGATARSPLGTLAANALADVVTHVRRARLSVPADDAADLLSRSEAALIEEGWFVRANVTVSKRRLKQIVRANTVVTLHGAGSRHSGNYLVSHVVHRIDDDDHWMDVTLIRNGWN